MSCEQAAGSARHLASRRTRAPALLLIIISGLLLCYGADAETSTCLPGTHAPTDGSSGCVACEADSFQPFDGQDACLPCPANAASADEGRSCGCGLGEVFESNVPSVTCNDAAAPGYQCTPSVGVNEGSISIPLYGAANIQKSCTWTISGVAPRVSITSLQMQPSSVLTVHLAECDDAECTSYTSIPSKQIVQWEWDQSGWEYQSAAAHLGVRFEWYTYIDSSSGSLGADWSTTSELPACSPCEAGTYKDTTDASECTACPPNTMSAEGSMDLSNCGCPAGFTVDVWPLEGCVLCAAGTYKSEIGSVTCTQCPSNTVSAEGSTGLSSCVCLSGYGGDAGSGEDCVACVEGTFKPFDSPAGCLPCPANAVTADEGKSCGCEAGHVFEPNFSSLVCGDADVPGCACSPSVGVSTGSMNIPLEGAIIGSCAWTISGTAPRVSITSLQMQAMLVSIHVDECADAECTSSKFISSPYIWENQGWEYQSAAAHLRVRFQWNPDSSSSSGRLGAEWSTSYELPECSPCEAGTYKDATDASECTACPTNAVSAEGSTAPSSCECPAGYSGDAGAGQGCVLCEAGTYKDMGGSATCTRCPSNAVSSSGSTGLSSCVCLSGYAGDAGSNEECVACDSNMFKPFDGPGACVPCPANAASADEGRSCMCEAALVFEPNIPSLTCGDPEQPFSACTPSVGVSAGSMNIPLEGAISIQQSCTWTISGAAPRVSITSLQTQGMNVYAQVDECDDAECTSSMSVFSESIYQSGWEYQSAAAHLRVRFQWNRYYSSSSGSLGAEWSTSYKLPECSPCEAGTYKDATDASECTACPTNAVSAEGSTAMSSCECPAGFSGDAGAGQGCVLCEAGTYKDVIGSAECTACPLNAVSSYGSTELRSCLCLSGYGSVSGPGVECVACDADTFKPFDGQEACLSCPANAASADGGKSCGCGLGHVFDHNIPSLTCSGSCPCTPSVWESSGLISVSLGDTQGMQSCTWTFSGAKPRVSITSLQMQSMTMSVQVDECADAECASSKTITPSKSIYQSGWEYQSAAAHLRVRFEFYLYYSSSSGSLGAEWSTSNKLPECSPCEAGTYKDATDASECTTCPMKAVSAEGSTALSSCECPAGYTGDAGAGQGCVLCEAGTYKDVSGSGTCTLCPSNTVSSSGSTGLDNCLCLSGYAGDAGLGEECVACDANMFKPFDGPDVCLSCPVDSQAQDGRRSCTCELGHVFEHSVPSLTCGDFSDSPGCACKPSVGVSAGSMHIPLEGVINHHQSCLWTISGAAPRVSITSLQMQSIGVSVQVDECEDADCTLFTSISSESIYQSGWEYQSAAAHLRVRFIWNRYYGSSSGSLGAEWSTSSKQPECSPCEADTYADSTDASRCTSCPTHAVSVEGSTARISCECPAGYTGDAGVGQGCALCDAGTYKDLIGSVTCTACPSNAVSVRGSTGLNSCLCRAGYTGDAGSGEDCVACDANTFKPLDGQDACLLCPANAASADEGRSCMCDSGHVFEHNVPSLTCRDADPPFCACTPSVGASSGFISIPIYNQQSCTWMISGAAPRVSITSLQMQSSSGEVRVHVAECQDIECTTVQYSFTSYVDLSGWEYQSAAAHLRVRFEWYNHVSDSSGGLVAEWSTSSKLPECSPCEAGTYTDSTDASSCTTCPSHAVSAEGSTSLNNCECPAGYTGDAGNGAGCVLCEAGTYKDVRGSAECTACPSNTVSATGSTGLSSCVCLSGYGGVSSTGEDCLMCDANTFKPFSGQDTCVSCPVDAESVDGGRSCGCGAGHIFEPNLVVHFTGRCQVTTSGLEDMGLITIPLDDFNNNQQYCEWTISGAAPRVSISALQSHSVSVSLDVRECEDAECKKSSNSNPAYNYQSGWEYQSAAAHLRVRVQWRNVDRGGCSLAATWSTTSKPPECALCEAGTYTDSTDASRCTTCPSHAVSADGSTALSSCECPAGYTGDAGVGESCVPCKAGTYKDAGGSAISTACPSNAVSLRGSTGLSGCFCPGGYAGDAGSGEECVACMAGTFKPFGGPDACLPCPANAVSAEDGKSCMCGAGKIFEHNVPNMTCSGSCPCTPSVGVSEGTIGSVLGGSDGSCTWTISGAEPRVSITSFDQGQISSSGEAGYMYLSECVDAECRSFTNSLANYQSMRTAAPLQEYTARTRHLRLRFQSSDNAGASFTATWGTASKLPECSPCQAGTYKDSTASDCIACPKHAVSASGSTARSDCECPAGYTGSTGVGRVCVLCEAGTYKGVGGSATCPACPSNAVSLRGSTDPSSCFCPAGYTGDAGSGEDCVPCAEGTFKPVNGSATCLPCPVGAASTDGARSCRCGAGTVFKHNIPRMTCSGSCQCTSSVGANTGTMTNLLDGLVGGDPTCIWTISGAEPSVSLTSFTLGYSYSGRMSFDECEDASCSHTNQLANYRDMRIAPPLQEYTASTGHLRFKFYSPKGTGISFAATWSTSSKQPECSPCEAGTYKDATDASRCIFCPPHTVSAEGSTARSNCECTAGYTHVVGQGCALCEAGTYKDVIGSAECTACPANAISLRGSTGLSGCFCPGGFGGDAGSGEDCVACDANTFKPFDGPAACLPCPGDVASAQGGGACMCAAGRVFEHNTPSVRCSGSCECPPSVGMNTGIITNAKEGSFGGNPTCTWIISGPEPSLSITSFDLGYSNDAGYMNVYECEDASCSRKIELAKHDSMNTPAPLQEYTVSTGHLGVRFYSESVKTDMNFAATWSTASKPAACSLCPEGTYKDSTGASKCTACPCNLISAEGSTALSSCECPAGYTGDAGAGCVLCEAGTYKDVIGSETCTLCPQNALSSPGSTDPSSCFCPAGYTVGAGSGSGCVPCQARPSPFLTNIKLLSNKQARFSYRSGAKPSLLSHQTCDSLSTLNPKP